MSMSFKVKNPATGELIQEITRNTEEEINQALENGQKEFKKWAKVNAHERSRLLSLVTENTGKQRRNSESHDDGKREAFARITR